MNIPTAAVEAAAATGLTERRIQRSLPLLVFHVEVRTAIGEKLHNFVIAL